MLVFRKRGGEKKCFPREGLRERSAPHLPLSFHSQARGIDLLEDEWPIWMSLSETFWYWFSNLYLNI